MLHFCMNWTPATAVGPHDAPFSSRTIPLSPVVATHTKTAGCVPTIPILKLTIYHTTPILVLSFHAVTNCPFSIPFVLTFMHRMGGVGGPSAFFPSPPATTAHRPLITV